jgi:hypothetical protein
MVKNPLANPVNSFLDWWVVHTFMPDFLYPLCR